MKVQTDKQGRINSTIFLFNENISFDENGIAEVSDETGKKMIELMEDISKADGKKVKKEETKQEDRLEGNTKNEDKVESSQKENISESDESEPLEQSNDESSDDEVPADTAKKEFQNMKVSELRGLTVQYGILDDESAKKYNKQQLVELLVEKVAG